jgi:alpha-mannosidase
MDGVEDASNSTTGFFDIDVENACIATVKRAENSEGYIIRVVETKGKTGRVTVELPFSAAEAHEADLLENQIDGVIDVSGSTISFELGSHEVKSIFVLPTR